ncbi:hypothetical protein [Neosynechococcus sphagnicola]|uniref:hypothetical protein n=1 Tax=Neosynechococcus sphagnicola TaxID=1501145 RepID=UPI003083F3A8
MQLLPSSTPPKFTPSSLTNLEDCTEESVYAPGYIQSHGMLLTLEAPDFKILQVSENVVQSFDISPAALLGQSLERLFPDTQVNDIVSSLLQNNLDWCNPFELKTRVKIPSPSPPSPSEYSPGEHPKKGGLGGMKTRVQTFRCTLHQTTAALILELEPQLAAEKTQAIQYYRRLQAILSLRSATSLANLAQTIAREVKVMTGFDRVMVYRFAADAHGVVIAEEKRGAFGKLFRSALSSDRHSSACPQTVSSQLGAPNSGCQLHPCPSDCPPQCPHRSTLRPERLYITGGFSLPH